MPAVSVPNTFTTGTNVLATPWNENFAALVTWLNTYAIQKDGSVAFTALPSIPTTTPTLDAQVASRKFVNDTVRSKNDQVVTFAVVPGGNTDTNTGGTEQDWITLIASQLVPSWATKCVVDLVVSGHYVPSFATAGIIGTIKVGTVQCASVRMNHTVQNARQCTAVIGQGDVTAIANTSVAVKLRATDDGTGHAVRIDVSSGVVGYLRFYS